MLILVCLYHELLLLRYEGYIEVGWAYLLLPVGLAAGVIGVFVGFIAF